MVNMIIDNIILKEKSISRENLQPVKHLGIKFNRMNYMPASAEDKFSCVIEISVVVTDENNNGVASAKIAFFIFASLNGDVFEQSPTADGLFEMAKFAYWQELNRLFHEVNLPPVPVANFFPKNNG